MKRSMRLSSVKRTRVCVRACACACVCMCVCGRGEHERNDPSRWGGGGGLPEEIFPSLFLQALALF